MVVTRSKDGPKRGDRKRSEPERYTPDQPANAPVSEVKKSAKRRKIGDELQINSRVAKFFYGRVSWHDRKPRVYFGTVDKLTKKTKPYLWHVRYDDDDEEEYDSNDLKLALETYKAYRYLDPTRNPTHKSINPQSLLQIVNDQDCSKMQKILQDHPDFDVNIKVDVHGRLFLYAACEEACSNGKLKMMKLLLSHGADPNAADEYGNVPLDLAVRNGRTSIMKLLVDNGADINGRDARYNRMPVHRTCYFKHLQATKFLLRQGVDIEASGSMGRTPLHEACRRVDDIDIDARIAIVRLLLKNGAEVNARDHIGDTPLHFAADDLETTKLLVQYGADANAQNENGVTPLKSAFDSYRGRFDEARFMLQNGASVHLKDKRGKTLLHDACNAETIALLVEHGADIHAKDGEGDTALLKAFKRRDFVVARSLVENGASVHDKDESGKTALHYIEDDEELENKYPSYRRYVFLRGPNLNGPMIQVRRSDAVDQDYDSGDEETGFAEYLLQNGADCNAKDKNGNTPLHLTSEKRFEIVKLLINNGTEINAQNNDGKTRFYLACANGESKVTKLLASCAGVDVNTKSKDGFTPLQIAAVRNHLEVVWFLLQKFPWLIAEHEG